MTYYDLLQVNQDAPDDVIRTAYRRLAKLHHPDSNPLDRTLAAARFRLVQEAYEHLRDPHKRATYNQRLKMRTWMPDAANNDNAHVDVSDVFTSARKTLERLMRMMTTTRTMPVQSTDIEGR